MKCKRVEILLPKYINKSISNVESTAVQDHLNTCDNCSILYAKLNTSLDFLKSQRNVEEQPFYYTRLKQKMEQNIDRKESISYIIFKQKFVQPILYLTSIILAVFIGILIGSNSSNQDQYTSVKNSEKSYTEIFAESQYLNDFEIETIENDYFENDSIIEE